MAADLNGSVCVISESRPQPLEALSKLGQGVRGLSKDEISASQRERIIAALAVDVAVRGYEDATVGSIVTRAGVSKSAFYAQFDSKLDCYLAGQEMIAQFVLRQIEAAIAEECDGAERLKAGITAYVDALTTVPEYGTTFAIEFASAGPVAFARRNELIHAMARRFLKWHEGTRVEHPEFVQISEIQGLAIVVAINETVFTRAREFGIESLSASTDEIVRDALSLSETLIKKLP